MRTIGLLGGMSWESSALYYRRANELVRDRLGGLHSARCVLYSVDFAGIAAMQRAGSWDDAAAELATAARSLEVAGADFVLLCTNTMHKVADQVQASLSVPLIHLADTTADAVVAAGIRRVGLLGTGFTMEQRYYRDRLATHTLDVVVPGPEDRAMVHRVIYDELCLGIVRDDSRAAYRAVIQRLVDEGCDGIILGCTEIELLVTAEDSPVPVFPTTELHVAAAVDLALAGD
jgi:aspartate racemase